MNDRMVWIDCEMTGLSLSDDALIEVAALVTDSELNVLGEGVDIVIRPPEQALETMPEVVRQMHTASGLLAELDGGTTLADAEAQVLAYVKEHVKEPGKAPLCGNSVGTDRGFLLRDMPTLEDYLHYRIVDVSSIKELARRWYPRAYFDSREERQPPRARRHPRVHRRTALLPGGRLRTAAGSRLRHREGDRRQARPARRPVTPDSGAGRRRRSGGARRRKRRARAPLRTLYTFSQPVGKTRLAGFQHRPWWV